MSKPLDGVFPCRNDSGKGWWRCQPHRATHWEARVRGKLIGRYVANREAHRNYDQAKLRSGGPYRPYSHGRQMRLPEWRG
jgi:hypothetical protein